MTATHTGHWANDIDVDELHEPTVRKIIDTMKRTGAPFAAHVLECQYRHDQISEEPNAMAIRLRQLADFIEANPDIDLGYAIPGGSAWSRIMISCNDADMLTHRRRQIGGRWTKDVEEKFFNLNGMLGDNHVQLYVHRDTVCERVVVGTEIELVPDPEAPLVEQEVEIIEWVCPDSILMGVEKE